MKLKTVGRLAGAFDAFVGGFIVNLSASYLSKANYDIISIFSSDLPLSYKMIGAGIYLNLGMFISLGSLMVIDGITDVVKGTHHYFGCRLLQKLTKNPERKEKIERDLEDYLKIIEKKVI